MKKPNNGSLTLKHRIGYGCGDACGVCTFTLMSTFFTRYCLNILGVSNALLATLLLVWNIWDGINDPLMGNIMDRIYAKHHNKNGKFRPWILRAVPMLTIAAIALWTVPTFFEGVWMVVVLFVCKILYEGCYTMLNIPMGSLLSAMANDDTERAQLSSARGFGSAIFGMGSAILFPLIVAKYNDTAKGYGIGVIVLAAIGLVLGLMHYFLTEERNTTGVMMNEQDAKLNVKDIIGLVTKNRPFLALCVHSIFVCSLQAITGAVGTYIYADVFGNLAIMSTASVLALPLTAAVLVFSPMIAKKLGIIRMIRSALIISAVLYAGLFAMLIIADVNVWVYVIWNCIAGTFSSVSILQQWGLVGEAIDYNEYISGKRAEGTMYGTFSLARRIGTTIGSSLVVLFIGWTGYDKNAEVQTEAVKSGLKFVAIFVPAIFVLGSWVAFRFIWNINADMRKKLSEFKESKSQNAETENAVGE